LTNLTGPEVAFRSTPEAFNKGQWATLADNVLLEYVLAGHDLAFEVLMERYTPLVVGYLYHRVNSQGDAEDLTQEVFLTAYRGLSHLRSHVSFRSWLMHILQSKLIDYYRLNNRRPQLISGEQTAEDPEGEGLLARIPSGAADPRRQAHDAETRSIIMREIAALGERFSTVIYLRLIEGLSTDEIARRLGMTSPSTRMRLFRGMRRLRKSLKKLGIGVP
jgi:RNA polymerase sigma-70 factor (ECF subfamily)